MVRLKKGCLLLSFIIVNSCNCDDAYTCPEIQSQHQSLLNVTTNDSILFTNFFGDTLLFQMTNRAKSEAYELNCGRGEPTGCYCRDCEASAHFLASCDTSYSKYNNYYLRIDEVNQEGKKTIASSLSISFLNFSIEMNLMDSTEINPTPLFSPQLTLGGKIFYNVYFFYKDTTQFTSTTLPVWQVYYTKEKGVIGFSERRYHSQYIIN